MNPPAFDLPATILALPGIEPRSAPSQPSQPSQRPRLPEHRLSLKEILDELVADDLIIRTDSERVSAEAREDRGELHPLVVIANKQLRQVQPPHLLLSLERLTEWLAGKVGLPYLRIDPLKLDIAAVERLLPFVSYEYATRYHLLPIAVDEQRVVFATTEPYLTEWREVLRQTLRKDIERVIASPLDINRYQLEFYGVSRSVRGALRGALEPASGILNFEQLLELGRRGELSADERPIVQIVDWLLQYAFSQRASDIHLEPRREQGRIRFRIDGVLHAIYQLPPAVMNAVTSRIKILGRMTWPKSADRRMAGSRRAPRRAGKSNCGCPPCPPPSARNACCGFSTRIRSPRISANWVSHPPRKLPGGP